MPKDWVGAAADVIFRDQMIKAEDFIAQNEPEFFTKGDPAEVRSEIRKTAKELYLQEAAQRGGRAGAMQEAFGQRVPLNTMEVGPGIINPTLSPINIGNVADLVGMGPDAVDRNPAGALASGAAMAASTLVPPLLPIGLMNRLGPGAERAFRLGESVLRPAAAAGAVGGTAAGVASAWDPASEITLDTDSQDEFSGSRVFADALNEAKNQAGYEVMGGVLGVAGSTAFRGIAQYARGSETFFRDALESLRLAGIRKETIALQDVTDRSLISSSGRILGVMPIPIIPGRYSRAINRKSDALAEARDEMLGTVSPTFSVIKSARELDPVRHDRAMRRATRGVFQKVERAVARYRSVRNPIDESVKRELRIGNYDSAAGSLRATALNVMNTIGSSRQLPPTIDRVTGATRAVGRIADTAGPVEGIVADITRMPPGAVPLTSLINMRADIRAALTGVDPDSVLRSTDRAQLLSLESALDRDIESAIQNSGNNRLIHEYQQLVDLDSNWITLIRGPVGQRAKLVDETFGRQAMSEASGQGVGVAAGGRGLQRNAGSLDQEQFLDSMLEGASPEEIRQFAIMARSMGPSGERALRFSAARQLDRAIEGATSKEMGTARAEVIKPERIEAFMKDKDPRGESALRFWTLIDEAGVDRGDIRRFTKAAKLLWREMPPNMNSFIQRSMILSGGKDVPKKIARIVTAGLVGASAGAGAVAGAPVGVGSAIFGAFLLERYSALATDPRKLQWVLRALEPGYGSGPRAQVIERIVADNLFRDWFSGKFGETVNSAVGALDSAQSAMGMVPPQQ